MDFNLLEIAEKLRDKVKAAYIGSSVVLGQNWWDLALEEQR